MHSQLAAALAIARRDAMLAEADAGRLARDARAHRRVRRVRSDRARRWVTLVPGFGHAAMLPESK